MVERVELNLQQMEINKGSGSNPLPPTSSTGSEIREDSVEINFRQNIDQQNEQAAKIVRRDEQSEKNIESKNEEELRKFVESLNEKLYYLNREVHFRVDEKIKRTYISVIDKKTKEVIKEYPPKEIRKFISAMLELEKRLNSGDRDLKEIFVNYKV